MTGKTRPATAAGGRKEGMAARAEGRRLVAAMRAMEGAGDHGGEAALDGMEDLPPLTDEGEGALLDDHALADALVDDHGVAVQLDRPEREHEAGANLALEPARVRSEEAAFKVEGAMGGLKLLSVDGKREGGPTPVALTTYTFSDEGARVKLRVDVKVRRAVGEGGYRGERPRACA